MELMPEPMALPGCCFRCRAGSNNRDFFIDFEFSMEFHGAVYICNECLAEMAHTAGYILPDEARNYKLQVNLLTEENEELTTKIFGLEQAIDGLRIAGRSFGTPSESDAVDFVHPAAEGSYSGQEELDFGAGELIEPLHDEGVAELSDDDAAVDFKFSV